MSGMNDIMNSNTESHRESTTKQEIPPLVPVKREVRELWESYRNIIEAKAQKHFSMPGTFQMVPLKVSALDINGVQTYFFKARIPNNRYVNVRIRLSGMTEPRDNQVAVESFSSGNLDEVITNVF